MMFQKYILIIIAAFALTSCASDGSSKSQVKKKKADKKGTTEVVQEAIYLNGITEENSKNTKGPIHLHGQMNPGSQNGYIVLWETEGKETYILDSAEVRNGSFDFGEKEYEMGFYAVSYRQANNSMGIILNPKEKDVELHFTVGKLTNAPSSVNSDENKGWFIYAPQEIAHFNKIKSLRKNLKNPAMKVKTEKMMAAEDGKLEQFQRDLIQQFPGTFLAKVMTWKQIKWHDDKSRYWDDIDFNDESIIRSPIINDRIQDYMRTHSGATNTGFLNAIDLIYQKSSVNPKVNAYCTLTLLEGFYSSKKEDMCLYIMDSYIYGENCGEGDTANLLKDRATGVKNLALGATPPNFKVPLAEGGVVDLHHEVKKHEYTLLFFWSSWCHKCAQETPEYKKLYNQYKSKGFEVIGISVDVSHPAWINAIAEKGTTWINSSMLNGWESPVAKGYRVHETPTLFLLNKDKQIVLKPQRWFEVRDFLAKNLN